MIDIDKIYNEDCLEGMKKIEDGSIDCVICDLPYGTTACAWDSIIPVEPLWCHWKRILKKQGSVLLFGSEPFSTQLRMSNLGWFKYDWIWIKNRPTGFQHAKNMPLKKHEIVSVFSGASMGHANLLGDKRMTYNPQGIEKCGLEWKRSVSKFGSIVGKRKSHKNYGVQEFTNFPTSVLEVDKDPENLHPTQKPVDLVRYFVRTYTNEGDLVLDNCMGSGTTAVACIREHRHFIGFEIDPKYYEISVNRVERELLLENL